MAIRTMTMRSPLPAHQHAMQMQWTPEQLTQMADHACRNAWCRKEGLTFKDHIIVYEWPSEEARVPYVAGQFVVDQPQDYHYFHGVYCPFVLLYSHFDTRTDEWITDAALCPLCQMNSTLSRSRMELIVEIASLPSIDHVSWSTIPPDFDATCSNCGLPGGRQHGR